MDRARVYVESSVVSYSVGRVSRDLVVAAHQQVTLEWWANVLPRTDAYVSVFVLEEVGRGDPELAKQRLQRVKDWPLLAVVPDVERLAGLYLKELQIPGECAADAYHMALATHHGMDYVASWNCGHIASGRVQRLLEEINASEGIRTPMLCTPEELMEL